MKQIVLTKQEIIDQMHVNAAYANVKAALQELVQVKEIDGNLHRLLRDMYN